MRAAEASAAAGCVPACVTAALPVAAVAALWEASGVDVPDAEVDVDHPAMANGRTAGRPTAPSRDSS